MNLQAIQTGDGSFTLLNTDLNLTYHSRYGALQESKYIYIHHGLKPVFKTFNSSLQIFEMGFGTGLNAWLTQQEAALQQRSVYYTALEKHPVPQELFAQLNYAEGSGTRAVKHFHTILHSQWGAEEPIDPYFRLFKKQGTIEDYPFPEGLHLVYYDAFDPEASPESWQPEIFMRLYNRMHAGACLVTFCAKGYVKRLLRHTGFVVESLPGPPGKREITRALKPNV